MGAGRSPGRQPAGSTRDPVWIPLRLPFGTRPGTRDPVPRKPEKPHQGQAQEAAGPGSPRSRWVAGRLCPEAPRPLHSVPGVRAARGPCAWPCSRRGGRSPGEAPGGRASEAAWSFLTCLASHGAAQVPGKATRPHLLRGVAWLHRTWGRTGRGWGEVPSGLRSSSHPGAGGAPGSLQGRAGPGGCCAHTQGLKRPRLFTAPGPHASHRSAGLQVTLPWH